MATASRAERMSSVTAGMMTPQSGRAGAIPVPTPAKKESARRQLIIEQQTDLVVEQPELEKATKSQLEEVLRRQAEGGSAMIHYEPNRAPFTEYIGAGLLDGVVIRKEIGSYVRASPETEAKWDFSDMSAVDRASYELPEYMPANYLVQSAITQRYGTVKAKQCSEAGYTEPTIDLFSSFVNIGGVDILLKYFKEGTAYSEICKADVLRCVHEVTQSLLDGDQSAEDFEFDITPDYSLPVKFVLSALQRLIFPIMEGQLRLTLAMQSAHAEAYTRALENGTASATHQARVVETDTGPAIERFRQALDDMARQVTEWNAAAQTHAILSEQLIEIGKTVSTSWQTQLGDEDVQTADVEQQKLTRIQNRIAAIDKVIAQFKENVRQIVIRNYAVPEQVKPENPVQTHCKFQFPKGFDLSDPNPEMPTRIIHTLKAIFHSYPNQLWALIPFAERLFIEYLKPNSTWRVPDISIRYKGSTLPEVMYAHYTGQNQVLSSLIESANPNVVKRTYQTFTTGEDGTKPQEFCSCRGNGLGSIEWIFHFHEQTGYETRSNIRQTLHYLHASLNRGNPIKKIEQMSAVLEKADKLQVKVDFMATVKPCCDVLRNRHAAFIEPMNEWSKAPDESVMYDALELFMRFLSDVVRLCRNMAASGSMNDVKSSESLAAEATFQALYNAVPGNRTTPLKPAKGQDDDNTLSDSVCGAAGCSKKVTIVQLERARKYKRDNPGRDTYFQAICGDCWKTLIDKRTIAMKSGPARTLKGQNKRQTVNARKAEAKQAKEAKKALATQAKPTNTETYAAAASVKKPVKNAHNEDVSLTRDQMTSFLDTYMSGKIAAARSRRAETAADEPEPEPEHDWTDTLAAMIADKGDSHGW